MAISGSTKIGFVNAMLCGAGSEYIPNTSLCKPHTDTICNGWTYKPSINDPTDGWSACVNGTQTRSVLGATPDDACI